MDEKEIIEKAIEEGAKITVGKLVDGISSFFSVICMPAAEEFGLYLKDRVAIYRLTNIHKVILKAQKRINKDTSKISSSVSPKLIKTIVDEASWAEDESVQEMWAGLLAGAALNNEITDESIIYVNQLKELSAYEARLVNLIYSDPRIGSVGQPITIVNDSFLLNNRLIFPLSTIFELSPKPLNHIVEGRSHDELLANKEEWGLALGFVRPQLDSLIRHHVIEKWEKHTQETVVFYPSLTGLDLYMRCTGYNVYPIEAYLLTRQAWAKDSGIDPFRWRPKYE